MIIQLAHSETMVSIEFETEAQAMSFYCRYRDVMLQEPLVEMVPADLGLYELKCPATMGFDPPVDCNGPDCPCGYRFESFAREWWRTLRHESILVEEQDVHR